MLGRPEFTGGGPGSGTREKPATQRSFYIMKWHVVSKTNVTFEAKGIRVGEFRRSKHKHELPPLEIREIKS